MVGPPVEALPTGPPVTGVELAFGMLVVALDEMDCGDVTDDVAMTELVMVAYVTEIK